MQEEQQWLKKFWKPVPAIYVEPETIKYNGHHPVKKSQQQTNIQKEQHPLKNRWKPICINLSSH